jgi:hypothetical protein
MTRKVEVEMLSEVKEGLQRDGPRRVRGKRVLTWLEVLKRIAWKAETREGRQWMSEQIGDLRRLREAEQRERNARGE